MFEKYEVVCYKQSYNNSTYDISSWGTDSSLCVTNGPRMIGWEHIFSVLLAD